jgi:hypothetical protein
MLLQDFLLAYFFGLTSVLSLLTLWFFSPFKSTLGKIIFKKELMPHEFDDFVYLKNNFLGTLVSCWICCSFWASLAIGVVSLFLIPGLTFFYPGITFLTYPSFCYIFYKFVTKQ